MSLALAPETRADWCSGGFGIYVHWPFCKAKCPYCDFNSHVSRTIDHDGWAEALLAEMAHMRALTGPRRADTLFFGGGTPSLMRPATVARLIEAADRLWGLAPGAEISLEANPTSAEAENFRGYAAAGVNRLSLGVQALDDADLKALGRQHTAAEAVAAFETARGVFARVSFDLIYARVGQTEAAWEAELSRALALAVDHLSLYQLTVEPGTRFAELHARGRLAVPGQGAAAGLYRLTQEITQAAGMPAYEISNHARPGAESRHNLIYWRYGDYAGIGPGAHGRVTRGGGRVATETLSDPAAWMTAVRRAGHGIAVEEALSGADQATEYLLMAMRLAEGAEPARAARLSGAALPQARVRALVADGLLAEEAGRIAATPDGRLVLNAILAELLA
ncbi:radical SAM family heme chaperone HemW [Paralimibaculum aggregatum]|uniref:Heme chaperone HemW n=1 Tax=Paralimibaculum aggregatum TaxID=3036245 RepID=A0ABQ6LIE7_9RHOB|nr:radical SAM family heme chaperone HemW [Limibaculum sp. NKW23]GMG82752.1 radical SAM family heme chaperone HemW [Limibaculum sp. NKW23]